MKKENCKNNELKNEAAKIEIPKDVQKEMLEFFMQTSIPRKKARIEKIAESENEKVKFY